MNFAEIIRSQPKVRKVFSGLAVHGLWWNAVLALHGKPSDVDACSDSSKLSLVRGFRFYGYLYLFLATVMFAIAAVIAFTGIANALFWSSLLIASSVFLVCTCQLAFAGSRRFKNEPCTASLLLLTFFVSIALYLSCLCGVCLSLVSVTVPDYGFPSLIGLAFFMVFGIGSYFIEILFLASYRPGETMTGKSTRPTTVD